MLILVLAQKGNMACGYSNFDETQIEQASDLRFHVLEIPAFVARFHVSSDPEFHRGGGAKKYQNLGIPRFDESLLELSSN